MKTYYDIATDGGSDVVGQVAEQWQRLQDRLRGIGHVMPIMSGKGGVGKSTMAVLLAEALSLKGLRVGIVDADINGPSIARMTGVRQQTPRPNAGGMQPAVSATGIRVMSMDLFLPRDATAVLWEAPTQEHAYTWRPMVEMGALRELIADTVWGKLDALFVDLPPGTDKLPNLADLVSGLSGAVVVAGPTALSHMVVARSITMATEVADVPIIGLVENKFAFVCDVCGNEQRLNASGNGAEALASAHGVPLLGRVPFDPRLSLAADGGEPFLTHYSDSPAGRAIEGIARRIIHHMEA